MATKSHNQRIGNQGMNGLVILAYMGVMFIIGILVGIVIENQHHKDELEKFRRTSHIDIETQMARDGWKI
jgi:uncharacterized protein YneF (UPF0154 family)